MRRVREAKKRARDDFLILVLQDNKATVPKVVDSTKRKSTGRKAGPDAV